MCVRACVVCVSVCRAEAKDSSGLQVPHVATPFAASQNVRLLLWLCLSVFVSHVCMCAHRKSLCLSVCESVCLSVYVQDDRGLGAQGLAVAHTPRSTGLSVSGVCVPLCLCFRIPTSTHTTVQRFAFPAGQSHGPIRVGTFRWLCVCVHVLIDNCACTYIHKHSLVLMHVYNHTRISCFLSLSLSLSPSPALPPSIPPSLPQMILIPS